MDVNQRKWLVYRRSDGWIGKLPEVMDGQAARDWVREVIAEGLTLEQATQMCILANEGFDT